MFLNVTIISNYILILIIQRSLFARSLTISLNEIGVNNGFSSKDFKIHQSVTAANWNVSDNVEIAIGTPTETLTND